jgi:hypothetical protein
LLYWSFLVYQVNQPGVVSVIWSSSCFSVNAFVPTMLMRAMRVESPSLIVKLIATRLRSCGVTVVWMSAPYLPRVMYWRLSSFCARSSAERSKMRASAMPMSFSAFLTVSVSNSLLPTNVSELIVGRSCTETMSTSPCASSRTSRKKPVA